MDESPERFKLLLEKERELLLDLCVDIKYEAGILDKLVERTTKLSEIHDGEDTNPLAKAVAMLASLTMAQEIACAAGHLHEVAKLIDSGIKSVDEERGRKAD